MASTPTRERFKASMSPSASSMTIAPLTLDPFAAIMAQRAGYNTGYVGGGGLGYALGISEALLTQNDLADATRRIYERLPDMALVIDGGAGFGDAIHAAQSVKMFENAGAVAIEIEDQIAPKRAHHHKDVEHLVSTEEFVGKIKACLDARRDENFVVIARSNAMQLEGIEATLERAQAYAEAGADMLMIRVRSENELDAVMRGTELPLATLGTWTTRKEPEMAQGKFRLLMDANSATILTYMALKRGYDALKSDPFYGFPREEVLAARAEVQGIIGLDELYALEAETTEVELLAELAAKGKKNNHYLF